VRPGPPDPLPQLTVLAATAEYFSALRPILVTSDPSEDRTIEWFLDNEFLLHRAVRQVVKDLPEGFFIRLPALTDGRPRIYDLARSFLATTELRLDRGSLVSQVLAYQKLTALRMSELWALPTMLRAVALARVVDCLAGLGREPEPPFQPEAAPEEWEFERAEVMGRAIQVLREVSAIRWEGVFHEVSLVERLLEGDPLGYYAQMDDDTRDEYRTALEEIAWSTSQNEADVARRVVAWAADQEGEPRRRRHVGYWLVGPGRKAFARDCNHRPALGKRLRALLTDHPTLTYLGGLTVAAALFYALPLWYLARLTDGAGLLALGALLFLLPASVLAVSLVQWALTHILPPRTLPKLDFSKGIPEDCRTMVVIPTLLGSQDEIQALIRQLEKHHLSNSDPMVELAILGDFTDADTEHTPADEGLAAAAEAGVLLLNDKYGQGGEGPFHLFLRKRLWNPAQGCWMAWERKRGKLEEFNRLLAGDRETTYTRHVGREEVLGDIRFIVTLDSDTDLPHGCAARLAGILAHPLNGALFDERSGRVVEGYTLVQPRVDVSPAHADATRFSRIYAGDTTIDIYSRAVSDVYQDLSGTGSFIGKGIYEVETFRKSLEGVVPENTLLSHDLFEGVHGRAGLASDVVLFEDYPTRYLSFARRMHRWIRGDWQILPWLLPRVRRADGTRAQNRLALLDRWRIFDNLRRSLVSPALLALLLAGWLVLPGNPWIWTLLTLAVPTSHVFLQIVTSLARIRRQPRSGSELARMGRSMPEDLQRLLLYWAFLPHEVSVVLDAVARTLFRLCVSKRCLLEWRSAAHTDRLLRRSGRRLTVWIETAAAPGVAVLSGLALALWNPSALGAASPLLALWALAPEIALFLAKPPSRRSSELGENELRRLRGLARRTWLFFETFIGPEDHWLPPDNFQEQPRGEVAHRTSPTNIGMMLVSTLAAQRMGYLLLTDLVFRLRNTLRSVGNMEHYRGHLLNWYDTRDLRPLEPRYVSTVDSGNLAGDLLVLQQGCAELAAGEVLREELWEGLADSLHLLRGLLVRIAKQVESPRAWQRIDDLVGQSLRVLSQPPGDLLDWAQRLREVCDVQSPEIDLALVEALRSQGALPDRALLRELRSWIDDIHEQQRNMRREVEELLPWTDALLDTPQLPSGNGLQEAWNEFEQDLRGLPRLDAIPDHCQRLRAAAERLREQSQDPGLSAWLGSLEQTLQRGAENARSLRDALLGIAAWAESEAMGMDFALLYDEERHLFRIGLNVSADRPDPNHYDLLASEARLASFLAIAKGDVPQRHWFVLGRPATRVGGQLTLLSWGATAFEYLMPVLLMRSGPETFLSRSCRASVDHQIAYGRSRGVPWGISESGFYHFDPDRNYQYRSFGVPGLGFRRGLADDLVVAPYASVLALSIRPAEVLRNLERLDKLEAQGRYGLHESLDYTPSRLPEGREFAIVRSYMAHHQGMILASIANHLHDGVFSRLFHSNPIVQTTEVLLNEQVPPALPTEVLRTDREIRYRVGSESQETVAKPWSPQQGASWPEAWVLSNGSLCSVFTDSGGGYCERDGIALTRFAVDSTREGSGYWIYVRDEDSGMQWSVGRAPTGVEPAEGFVSFLPYGVELHRRDHGIALGMELTVAPDVDVELRRVTLTNETGVAREITLASCAEVALSTLAAGARHPAFDKLFVSSELVQVGRSPALLFVRRPRGGDEPVTVLVHKLLVRGRQARPIGFETDRERFLGRHGDARRPRALDSGPDEDGGGIGAVLDPILSMQATVSLAPRGRAELVFVLAASDSRSRARQLAERFSTFEAVKEAFDGAARAAARELDDADLAAAILPTAQRLLSVVLFPRPGLREVREAAAAQRYGKPKLWSFGISGDEPIVALRIAEGEDTEALEELLQLHRLLRGRGVSFDLAVLREGASGYEDEVMGPLQRVIEQAGAQAWMNRRGGVFIVRMDQIPAEDRDSIPSAARAIFHSGRGSIDEQLQAGRGTVQNLPTFAPRARGPYSDEPTPALERDGDLSFSNPWGGLSADGSEYVIHVDGEGPTPGPWCNVIANSHFGCLTSDSGLGYTWAGNAGEFRLTPWRNDPVCDEPAEVLYLRDEETGAVWSTTPRPLPGRGAYQTRHGIGSTTWRHHGHGLLQETTVFVSPDEPVKYVRLRVRNAWSSPRRLTATYFAEWVLGVTREEGAPHVVPWYDPGVPALFARSGWNPEFGERVVFLAADHDVHGFTADRREFLGRDARSRIPAALLRWGLAGRAEPGCDPCAALQVHLEIEPGAEVEAIFVMGEGSDREQAVERARAARESGASERAWLRVQEFWEEVTGALQVETPDPAFDALVNRWLPYQSLSSRVFGRTGFYQSSGAFGFRDQLQDSMALVVARPALTRAPILEAARHQFEAGDVQHWWHPPGDAGVRTRCSDDYLWLVFTTVHYVRATGDESILAERVPFLRADPLGVGEADRYARFEFTSESYELFEHCRRALVQAAPRGAHGLPLMGDGDWNDGMNRVGIEGRGESVWLAWFLCACYSGFAELCERRGLTEEAARWRDGAGELARTIEREGWDGAWYRRAYDDDGKPLGSSQSAECQIDSIAQSWSVISGFGDRGRAALAVAAAYEHLVQRDERLILLLTPPFDRGPQNPGYIRGYPPGVRENGGQYTHAATWLGWACAELGDGDRAAEVFGLINPLLRTTSEEDCRRYRVEPYALAADVYGVEPHVGRGGWTWYTGAAAWLWRLGIEAILGLRLLEGRLTVEPHLPNEWQGYSATVRTPNGPCRIRVTRVEGSSAPRLEAELNGTPVELGAIQVGWCELEGFVERLPGREPA